MGRGAGRITHSSSLLYGSAKRPSNAALHLARQDAKTFYVLFELQFNEQLKELARQRFARDYPAPKYDVEVLLPSSGLPDDASVEEQAEDQDDDFLISCNVLSRDRDGNWGFDCHDGFYLTVDELLELGWHREGTGLQERCLRYLGSCQTEAEASDPG